MFALDCYKIALLPCCQFHIQSVSIFSANSFRKLLGSKENICRQMFWLFKQNRFTLLEGPKQLPGNLADTFLQPYKNI